MESKSSSVVESEVKYKKESKDKVDQRSQCLVKEVDDESKDDEVEAKYDRIVEAEWETQLHQDNEGQIAVSSNPAAKKICDGLKMYVVFGY